MATDVNAIHRTTLEVYDENGDLTDPATKVLTVTEPDQTTSTPSVNTSGTGCFYVDVLLDAEGLWKFQWVTTGPNTSKIDFETAVIYRSVIGLGEARDFLGLSSEARDEILRNMLMAATDLAESIVGTCVVRQITSEHIPGTYRDSIRVPSGPIFDSDDVYIESVWSAGSDWTNDGSTTELMVYPEIGVVEPVDGDGFDCGPWRATYMAGRAVIPTQVIMAVKLIIYDLWSSQRGLLTDPLVPNYEDAVEYEARIPPGYEMPSQAKALLMRVAMPGFG